MHDRLREAVQALAFRLSHLGLGADLAAMPFGDLWGASRFLRRLADG